MRAGRSEFVQVPLWMAEAVFKATRSRAALLILTELLRQHRRQGARFPVPNGRLEKLGVSRETRRRVLHKLAKVGLIAIEQTPRKTLVVTFISI